MEFEVVSGDIQKIAKQSLGATLGWVTNSIQQHEKEIYQICWFQQELVYSLCKPRQLVNIRDIQVAQQF
jgi:hypothetical protein